MSALVELSSGQLARKDLSENDKKQWQTALEASLKGQQDVLNTIQSTGGMEKGMSDMANILNAGATENSRYMRDAILATGAQIQGMQKNGVLANPTAGLADIKSNTGNNDVSMEIDEKLKEVKIDTQSGFASALTEMRAEFTDSLKGIVDKVSSQSSNGMQEQMLEALQSIARTNSQSADTSSKILQASRN